MIKAALCVLFLLMLAVFFLLVKSRPNFERVLLLNLLTALITAEIVLYAALMEISMYLDVALAFSILGFMDVQFYSVYLRKKGAL